MGQSAQYQEAGTDAVLDRRYRLRREIARGGHGAVFEAEHLVTHAHVAIKTLARPALDQEAAQGRFVHEGRILAAMGHPNIIAVHDAGTCPTYGPFLVLELIEGRPLSGILLTRRRLGIEQTVALVVQLCAALDHVARHGVVHRDVKPSNLLISRGVGGDQAKLIDFGVAQFQATKGERPQAPAASDELLGTVEYMAPEQLMGTAPVDARSDIYAVGVVLYECLTGEAPYSGTATTIIANMLAGTPPPAIRTLRSDVPAALEAVVRKACEIEPIARFSSAAELARACVAARAGKMPMLELLDPNRDRDQPAVAVSPADVVAHRRQYVRAPYVTPVRIVMTHGVSDGRTEDLSEGGVLLMSDGACTDGEHVTLQLPMPETGRMVELDATTKWTKTGRNQRAIGAEFVDPPEDIRAAIRAYVAQMSDLPPPVA